MDHVHWTIYWPNSHRRLIVITRHYLSDANQKKSSILTQIFLHSGAGEYAKSTKHEIWHLPLTSSLRSEVWRISVLFFNPRTFCHRPVTHSKTCENTNETFLLWLLMSTASRTLFWGCRQVSSFTWAECSKNAMLQFKNPVIWPSMFINKRKSVKISWDKLSSFRTQISTNSHLTSRAVFVFVKRERGGGQRITGLSPPGLPDWPHNFVQLPVKWAEVAWSTLMDGALLCLAACSGVEPIPHGKSKLWLTISWWNIWDIIHLQTWCANDFLLPYPDRWCFQFQDMLLWMNSTSGQYIRVGAVWWIAVARGVRSYRASDP